MTYDIRNRLSNLTASYAGRSAFELSYLYNQVGQDGSYFDEGPSRFNQVTEGGHVAQVTTQVDARNLPRRIGWTGFPFEGSKTGIQYMDFERNARGDVTGTSSFSIDSDFVLRNDAPVTPNTDAAGPILATPPALTTFKEIPTS